VCRMRRRAHNVGGVLPAVGRQTGHMPVLFNHTIVAAPDAEKAAAFVAEILGLPAPTRWAHFVIVKLAGEASLDYIDSQDPITPQHYAFLITEPEFDEIYGRILERGIDHWADPMQARPGEYNTNDGGRGVYFQDLAGHFFEVLTRPYGSGSQTN
jgi:catechol 2,3-dioxygenase-like lactoylglutathione lyase family enzyme